MPPHPTLHPVFEVEVGMHVHMHMHTHTHTHTHTHGSKVHMSSQHAIRKKKL